MTGAGSGKLSAQIRARGDRSSASRNGGPEISVSSGSACTSASVEPSYVLRALGLSDAMAAASVRVGFGRTTSEADIDTAIEAIVGAVTRLRGASTRAAE